MPTISAIIFDWGGVLIDDPAPPMLSYLSRVWQVSPQKFALAYKKYEADFQTGNISEQELWNGMAVDLKKTIPQSKSLWGEAFRQAYSPKAEIFELAATLKSRGCKIALLSNTELPAVEFFHSQNYDIFDALTFSCVAKTRKPEKEIYELTLQRLQVKPSEAIFIDDRKDYIRGAQRVGLNTILFENFFDVRKRLLEFLIEVSRAD
jgi:HAD superfamily hydrolase (TIGR01549 family)